jgi:hypothetical protein
VLPSMVSGGRIVVVVDGVELKDRVGFYVVLVLKKIKR